MEPVKSCKKCQITKPVSAFYKELKGAHKPEEKLRTICRDCWNGKEPPTTDDERKQFAKLFVVDYIAKNGETADEFFCHWISHKYPEITRHIVERAISAMTRSKQLKVTRRESTGDFNLVRFLALA